MRPLAQGGMGSVYVVEQLSTSKQRALKLMRKELVADDGMRARFEQEARIRARIASEHVAAGVDEGTPYLVMELLQGEPLVEHVRLRGALPVAEAVAVVIHASARVEQYWLDDAQTRSGRAMHIGNQLAGRPVFISLCALAAVATAGYWMVRIRKLPRSAWWRSLTKADVLLAVVVLAWAAADAAMRSRIASGQAAAYESMRPELDIPAELDPPTAEGLPRPPLAPTLKLGRERVTLGSNPVGLVSALEGGTLEAVLLGELSHTLAGQAAKDPRLLLMADRSTSWTRMLAALRVMRKAGADHVGVVYTRSERPTVLPSDPPETSYVIPSDLGMHAVELSPCPPAVLHDWVVTLQREPTVCVGP